MCLQNVVLLYLYFIVHSTVSQEYPERGAEVKHETQIVWCTGNIAEQAKCQRFAQSVKKSLDFKVTLFCKKAPDREQCMNLLDSGTADLVSLDPGEIFVAGRYHSLVPIMSERYGQNQEAGYYAVAVVHSNSDIRDLHDLRGKRVCFPGVGQFAGWVLPLSTLIERQVLNVTDCNNLVKSASDFFGPSCAPGSLIDKYNPSGDNPQKMCELCVGFKGERCSGSDPYAQFEGAFRCLYEGGGEVAFIKHTTAQEMTSKSWYRGPPRYDFRLLCPSGVTASLEEYHSCNWGYVPGHAVVTLSAALPERRMLYQEFLTQAVKSFGIDAHYSYDNWNRNSTINYTTTPFPWDSFNNRDPLRPTNSSWNTWNNNTNSRDQYDNRRDQWNRDRLNQSDDRLRGRDQFDNRRDEWNRDRYNQSDDRQGGRDQYDNRRDQFNRDRYNQSDDRQRGRDQFDRRDQWDRDRDQYDRRRDQWDSRQSSPATPYYDPYFNGSRRGFERRQYFENVTNVGGFMMFDSSIYGEVSNLLFQDSCTNLMPIPDSQQTFKGYLGSHSGMILGLRKCPVSPTRLCLVSDKEYEKCLKMKTAFKAQMLKPDLGCVKAVSQLSCMAMVADNAADLVVLDAGDIYKAGQRFGLIPIIAEQYDIDDLRYFAVAVTIQPDKTTDLLYLKGKRSCHSGIGTGAGWIIPMSFLITSERMRSYGCNSVRAASEFFQKSCVPGALSREFTFGRWGYDNLCDLCHGSSYHYCSREAGEPFYGDTGALRCLVEGGGEIAFVRHTTILQNAGGKNPAWWSRPMMPEDFELLCRDGTRARHDQYRKCNLGSVASNAIMTSPHRDPSVISAYINLFMYAQQFYGSKYSEDFTFKMFVSEDRYHDLIFQDSTQQLKVVPQDKRNYRAYLGNEFLRSVLVTDCTAGAFSSICSSVSVYIVAACFLLVVRF